MRFLTLPLLWLLLLVVAIIVLTASVQNSMPVTLRFLEFTSPSWPLAWWVGGAFTGGIGVGALFNLWTNTRLRLALRRARAGAAKQAATQVDRQDNETTASAS